MNFFTMNVADRFEIKTEAKLVEHNLDVLYECQDTKERYRIRRGIFNGRNVVIMHIAKSRWDKFMSYLPSCCFLRKRFINQLSCHARNDKILHNKLGYMQQHNIKVPFLSDRKLSSILAHEPV